jgi:hypothetical protein
MVKPLALKRGLCRRCYEQALFDVMQGKTTWAELEAASLAVPPKSHNSEVGWSGGPSHRAER